MNRKNLTAAVLAGLAGVAGLAGTAQAVNLNPDGLGQVLIYPYYTTNGGNQTILSVVNTTDSAKAVKVRFLEGYNSREVLDFNLYLSHHDVWVAAVADDGAGTPTLYIPDTSCTVPYLYGDFDGVQPFLPYAYSGKFKDGGPETIDRATEGHIEMIEMGTLTNEGARAKVGTTPARMGPADAATHVVTADGPMPADCDLLVRNWTDYDVDQTDSNGIGDGMWFNQSLKNGDQAVTGTDRNSGGLFGGAAVVNSDNGTMFSYDAKAIQGYDKTSDGVHFRPGNDQPSLDDGSERKATVFFGVPSNQAVTNTYSRGVDAISAVFMHDNLMNTFTIQEDMKASTEWVFTFPTKSFYVDKARVGTTTYYEPDPTDAGCNGWDPGEPFPTWDGKGDKESGWEQCAYIKYTFTDVIPPFTEGFDGTACEIVYFSDWDREESATTPGTPGSKPPIVSPPPPGGTPPSGPPPFELCYEVNVLRFGEGNIFGSDDDMVRTVSGTADAGWANINFSYKSKSCSDDGKTVVECHQDSNGLVGLPVTGFAAEEYENGFVGGGSVLANYGGLFQHKGSVRALNPSCDYHKRPCD